MGQVVGWLERRTLETSASMRDLHASCGCLLVCCVENWLLLIVTVFVKNWQSCQPLGRMWEERGECLLSLRVSEVLLILCS